MTRSTEPWYHWGRGRRSWEEEDSLREQSLCLPWAAWGFPEVTPSTYPTSPNASFPPENAQFSIKTVYPMPPSPHVLSSLPGMERKPWHDAKVWLFGRQSGPCVKYTHVGTRLLTVLESLRGSQQAHGQWDSTISMLFPSLLALMVPLPGERKPELLN